MQKKNTIYPGPGPPWVRSNTCLGFSSHWNFWSSLAPWLPPLLGLMNTRTGFTVAVGIGFIANVLGSFLESFPFFLVAFFFFGDFRSEDLKLPRRGSLTIQDGGTIMADWEPEEKKLHCQVQLYSLVDISLITNYVLKKLVYLVIWVLTH